VRLPAFRVPRISLDRADGGAGLLETRRAAMSLGLRLFEIGQLFRRSATAIMRAALPRDLRERHRIRSTSPSRPASSHLCREACGARWPHPCHAGRGTDAGILHRYGKAYCVSAGSVVRDVITAGMRRRNAVQHLHPGHLFRELERVRATGLAYEREESQIGVICVAARSFFDNTQMRNLHQRWTIVSRSTDRCCSKRTAKAISERFE